jgi:DNA-binding transcriptional LysR family regulator
MLDTFTLDQLRIFVAVADEGSFSAAARRVQRVQSAVSHAMANLENELGLVLWDRSTRVPTLTAEGVAILQSVRRVLASVDQLRNAARGLSGGLEATLKLCVDQLFPIQGLVSVCKEFATAFPDVALEVRTETLAAVVDAVRAGRAHLGVAITHVDTSGLTTHHMTSVRLQAYVGKDHPLAAVRGKVPTDTLREHVQIVLSERGDERSPDQGVLSTRTWRVADLATKAELIRAGLGWGNLPVHLVRDDPSPAPLIAIRPESWDERGLSVPMAVVHRPELPLGPATRWLLSHLTEACQREVRGAPPADAALAPQDPAIDAPVDTPIDFRRPRAASRGQAASTKKARRE